jgi:hypothetical protein
MTRRQLVGTSAVAGLAGALGLPVTATVVGAPPANAAGGPSLFARFCGACQSGSEPSVITSLGLTWDRQDLSWASIQPGEGEWDDSALDAFVSRVHAATNAGANLLPVLDYTAPWAARADPYSFIHQGDTFDVGTVISATDSNFVRRVVQTAPDGTVVSDEEMTMSRSKTPPRSVDEWVAYINHVTDALVANGVSYLQVWNEAWWGSGFWLSGMDDYFDTIHNPAAEAIHAKGGRVVYGGWPADAPNTLADQITEHNAWDTVDVLDVHYRAVNSMPSLLAAMATESDKPRLWQTEYGFTTAVTTIPNLWPRLFSWALSEGLAADPDMVKMFWFAWSSPDDSAAYGYGKCLMTGAAPSDHGQAIRALVELLNETGTVSTFQNYSTEPAYGFTLDGSVSCTEGFLMPSGKRVIALHMKNPPATIIVTISGLSGSADRVDIFGNHTAAAVDGDTVSFPSADPDPDAEAVNANSTLRTVYLELT